MLKYLYIIMDSSILLLYCRNRHELVYVEILVYHYGQYCYYTVEIGTKMLTYLYTIMDSTVTKLLRKA